MHFCTTGEKWANLITSCWQHHPSKTKWLIPRKFRSVINFFSETVTKLGILNNTFSTKPYLRQFLWRIKFRFYYLYAILLKQSTVMRLCVTDKGYNWGHDGWLWNQVRLKKTSRGFLCSGECGHSDWKQGESFYCLLTAGQEIKLGIKICMLGC